MDKKSHIKGEWLILAATVCWSLSGLFFRLIPTPALLTNLLRNAIALPIIIFYKKRSDDKKFRFNKTILLGGLCIVFANNFYFLSLSLTSVGSAIVLQYVAPIFVLIMSCIKDRKLPRPVQIGVVALAFTGVTIVFGNELIGAVNAAAMLGNSLALASGLALAGVFFVNRLPDASPIDSTITGFAINLIPGIFFLSQLSGLTAPNWTAIIGLGVIQHALAFIFFSRGIRRCASFDASLIGMLEVVLAPLFAFLLVSENVSVSLLLGGIMIMAAVLFNTLQERKRVAE